jgi:hypothetical protein
MFFKRDVAKFLQGLDFFAFKNDTHDEAMLLLSFFISSGVACLLFCRIFARR